MEHEGQGLMSLTLAFHWMRMGPSKGCGVNLCHFVTLGRGKHSVGKYSVWELFLPQHPVVCREAAGESRIETGPHPALSGNDHRAFSMVRGDHPPGGQGLWVNRRNIARSNMSIKACFNTRDYVKIWWKFSSSVRSTRSVVKDESKLMAKMPTCPLTAAQRTTLPE
jgi:hypothetical protein